MGRITAGLMAGIFVTTSVGTVLAADDDIQEVIVTAQKREQEIKDVPASISALTAESLQERQIASVEGLSFATPNFKFALQSGNVPVLSIRGVSADGTSPLLENTVALHIDGVYQPRSLGAQVVLSDLQGVEVLRGPQGTLYGRNANGGVVNINTARPTQDWSGSFTAGVGSFDRYDGKGYISGPLTEKLSFRLSGMFDKSHGYVTNLLNGDDLGGVDNWGAKLALQYRPTDSVTIDAYFLKASLWNNDPFYVVSDPLQGTNPTTGLPNQNYSRLLASGADGRYTLTPWALYQSYEPYVDTQMRMATGIVSWDINENIAFKSVTGWQKVDTDIFQDNDAMPTIYLNGRPNASSDTFSQEFNLVAKLFDRADTVLGLYYLKDNVFGGNQNPIPPGNPYGAGLLGLHLYNIQQQVAEAKAAFLDVTYSVTDRFRVLAGVRVNDEKRDTTQFVQTLIATTFPEPFPGTRLAGCANGAVKQPTQNFDSTTTKFGLQFDVNENVTTYLTRQEGFKAGAYNPSLCGDAYLPEEITSYEVGVRTKLLDGRLTVNATYFDYDYENMQLQRTFAPPNGIPFSDLDNSGTSTLKGGEIEAAWRFNANWNADLGIGILDGEFGRQQDGTLFQAINGARFGATQEPLTGKKLPRAPDLTFNLGVGNVASLGSVGQLRSRVEWSYTGKQYFTPFNEAIAMQDSYSVVNAFFTLNRGEAPWSVQVYGKNLTDEAYLTGVFTSGIMFFGRGTWAPPRTWGVELTTKF